LFEEVVRQTLGELLDVAETVAPAASAEQTLRNFMAGVWDYARSPAFETIYRLVLAERNRFPQLGEFYTREVRDGIMAVSSEILEAGMRSGEFRTMDVASASRMLLALVVKHGVWCGRRETWPDLAERSDAQVLDEIIEFYLYALRPSGPAEHSKSRRQS
jgi:hypothetical protein